MTRLVGLFCAMTLFALAGGACGHAAKRDAATPLPTAAASATAVPTRSLAELSLRAPTTGVDSVDRVVEAVRRRDASALEDLVQFTPQPCGGTLACPAGEPEGTKVDAVLQILCDATYLRRAQVPMQAADFVSSAGPLFAVVQSAPGEYVAVFEQGRITPAALLIDDHGITTFRYGCGATPTQLSGENPHYLLPPGWSAQTAPPHTGVATVDALLSAMQSNDAAGFEALMVFQPMKCQLPQGVGSIPCPEGKPAGTDVAYFVTGQCEGGFTAPGEDARRLAIAVTSGTHVLLAVAQRRTAAADGDAVAYSAIYARLADASSIFSIGVSSTGVGGVTFGCPGTFARFVDTGATFLVRPGWAVP